MAFADLEQELSSTRRILERVPEEKLDWKPHSRSWSLGSLAAHLANLPQWIVMTLQSDHLDLADPGPPVSPPGDRSELLEQFDGAAAMAREAVAAASEEDLTATWTLRDGERTLLQQPRAVVLRHMCLSHLVHHRGQLTVYLRLLDVPLPQTYGPTADEPNRVPVRDGEQPEQSEAAVRTMGDAVHEGSVERSVQVNVSREAAFRGFVDRISDWWPREYTWSGESLKDMGIDEKEGGRCWELGPDGFRCDWGTIIEWNPPARIALRWQINPDRTPAPDPSRASRVEITFEALGSDTTRATVLHGEFDRHGDGAEDYIAGMGGSTGWSYLLRQFEQLFD